MVERQSNRTLTQSNVTRWLRPLDLEGCSNHHRFGSYPKGSMVSQPWDQVGGLHYDTPRHCCWVLQHRMYAQGMSIRKNLQKSKGWSHRIRDRWGGRSWDWVGGSHPRSL